MKYIFLDIDGVLNTYTGKQDYVTNYSDSDKYRTVKYDGIPFDFLEVRILRKLHEIVYKTGAVIVGVSSWFSMRDTLYENQMMEQITKALSLPIYDISDYFGGGKARGRGVISWLNKNNYNPEKDSFVIIDDSQQYYDFEIKAVNSRQGLTDKYVQYAINILNSKGENII